MPQITLNRNENVSVKVAKKPGVMILGKNRNFLRSELEKAEFRVKFVNEVDDSIDRLIIIANDDYAEALKNAFLADEAKIPHLLVTTAVNGKCSVRFLHIMYTDEESETFAVSAVINSDSRDALFAAPESYYVHAFGENEQELFANMLDRLPNYNFGSFNITINAPQSISNSATLTAVKEKLHPNIEIIPDEAYSADVICI
jgi:hypothetical protein